MAKYKLNHAYSSHRDGQQFGPWAAGDEVDLDDDVAQWVERDSPGALAEVKAKPDKAEERAQPPARDRQHRGGSNRGA